MWTWIVIVTLLVASGALLFILLRRGVKSADPCCACPAEMREKCGAVKGAGTPPPECPSPPK